MNINQYTGDTLPEYTQLREGEIAAVRPTTGGVWLVYRPLGEDIVTVISSASSGDGGGVVNDDNYAKLDQDNIFDGTITSNAFILSDGLTVNTTNRLINNGDSVYDNINKILNTGTAAFSVGTGLKNVQLILANAANITPVILTLEPGVTINGNTENLHLEGVAGDQYWIDVPDPTMPNNYILQPLFNAPYSFDGVATGGVGSVSLSNTLPPNSVGIYYLTPTGGSGTGLSITMTVDASNNQTTTITTSGSDYSLNDTLQSNLVIGGMAVILFFTVSSIV